MKSQSLTEAGLLNYIAGSDYNFRYHKIGDQISQQYEQAMNHLEQKPQEVYSGTQVHGDTISYCDGENGKAFIYGRNFVDSDGLITDQPGVALVIKYADCTPIVIYDPVRQVQASVHSGWRGTVQEIGRKAVDKMIHEFGSNISDLVVFLGPSIDQTNYEVGPEVYEAFTNFEARDQFFIPHKDNKYLLSMQAANYALLLDTGIKPEQIEVAPESTYTSPALHSARQEKEAYALNAIITMIPYE